VQPSGCRSVAVVCDLNADGMPPAGKGFFRGRAYRHKYSVGLQGNRRHAEDFAGMPTVTDETSACRWWLSGGILEKGRREAFGREMGRGAGAGGVWEGREGQGRGGGLGVKGRSHTHTAKITCFYYKKMFLIS
jgi:hypothetical protein